MDQVVDWHLCLLNRERPEGPESPLIQRWVCIYNADLIGKSNCKMVLGFYSEHPRSRRENAIKSCASAEEEEPPITAIPTTTGDKATSGSTSRRCRTEAGGDPPKEKDKLEHALLERGKSKLLIEDSVGEIHRCLGTAASLDPTVKKLPHFLTSLPRHPNRLRGRGRSLEDCLKTATLIA
jgi:hypothetical protein